MKHLKKINELIHIDTYNLDSLKHLVGKKLPYRELLNEINAIVDKDDVFFMDVNDFKQWYDEEIKKLYPEEPPLQREMYPGIILFATFPEFSEDSIVIVNEKFKNNFKNNNRFEDFKDFIEKIITHENIHKVQASKKDPKHIPHADVANFKEYVTHPDELMAWANTAAHEIYNKHETLPNPDRLKFEMLWVPSARSFLSTVPDKNDPIRKKFLKYVYQYVIDLFEKDVKKKSND